MPFIRRGPARPVLLLATLVAALGLSAPGWLGAQNANLIGVKSFSVSGVENGPSGVRGNPLLGSDGNIYVASSSGGTNGGGTVTRITPAGELTVLAALTGSGEVGAQPYSGLMQASDGNFYGTTYTGGTNGRGTVYRINSAGTYATLYSFTADKNAPILPYAGLVQGPDGFLYGTTLRGGPDDAGVVFKVSLTGEQSVVYSFTGGKDGKNPEGTLIVGADGNFYGTTLIGGDHDRGVIYRMTPSGQVTTVYSFPTLSEFNTQGLAINVTGANPRAGLLLGADGNFYGTAYQGGASGYGTVFRMTPAGVVTTVHDFTGPPNDGGFPLASVSRDADGNYYGTTERGGSLGRGAVWRLGSDGSYQMLHGLAGGVEDGQTLYTAPLPVGAELYVVSFTDILGGSGALFKLQQRVGGVLPVNLVVSPKQIDTGGSAAITWSSPTATTCVRSGSWADNVSSSGSEVVTPPTAGYFSYVLNCTDGAGISRNAYATLVVQAPALDPVDGGGGGGAIAPWLLLALSMLISLRLKTTEAR